MMMDVAKIENTLRPETVNEVLLLNRINELKRAGYEKGLDFSYPPKLDEEILTSYPALMELRLAVEVESGWKDDFTLAVRARSYGPDKASLSYQYYMGLEALHNLTPNTAAQMLGMQHDRLIRSLAKALV